MLRSVAVSTSLPSVRSVDASEVARPLGMPTLSTAAPEWPEPFWVNLRKHVPPPNVDWDELVEASTSGVAVFKPEFSAPQDREQLEMRCVREGVLFKEEAHKRRYYLELAEVVGASDGEETTFVAVEQLQNGQVHGRPIAWREIQRAMSDRAERTKRRKKRRRS